jgi:SAM-dependent methyltransferase
LHTQSFRLYEGLRLPDAYDVISCEKCGFVYVDTPITQHDYNCFYSEFSKYESQTAPCSCRLNSYDSDKYERITRDLKEFVSDKQASILDIGCAKGGLLATLKLNGYTNLTGLDPSFNCVKQVKAQGINAIQGGLFKDNFPGSTLDQTFDCVIISHVIEHIYDLNTAIENLLSFVKNGGLLYIEIPDASRYTQYYVAPFHYFDLEHINHFDEYSLNNLISKYKLKQVGLGKNDLQHSNAVYYPIVYSIYQKTSALDKQEKIIPNFETRDSVIRYVEMSRQADHWSELEKLVKTQEEIVVWGAGAYALRLYKTSSLKRCNIISFIDNDHKKQGRRFDAKIKIQSPKDALSDFKGTVVVCSAVYNNEIVKEIEGMAINNRIVVLR